MTSICTHGLLNQAKNFFCSIENSKYVWFNIYTHLLNSDGSPDCPYAHAHHL